MPTLTEPQTWTMIGAVIALMFGMLTIVSTLFIRIDRLDRDVRALVKHTFGLDRG